MISRLTFIIFIVTLFAILTMFNHPFFAVGAIMSSPVTIAAILISFIYTDYRSSKLSMELKKMKKGRTIHRTVDVHEEKIL